MKKDAAELKPEIEITNPILCDVIERNIQILNHLRERASNRRSVQQKLSDAITNFSGSIPFVYLHALWFLVWIGWNDGKLGLKPFDPFPTACSRWWFHWKRFFWRLSYLSARTA